MLTLRNTINIPLNVDAGPTFGVVHVPAMGYITLDGSMTDLQWSQNALHRIKSKTLIVIEGAGGDPNEGRDGLPTTPPPPPQVTAPVSTKAPAKKATPTAGPIAPWADKKA